MKPAGGLKFALKAAGHDERRVRFARVFVSPVTSEEEIGLVTDSRGRLRYRLVAGEYRVRSEGGGATSFVVHDRGWTTVRILMASEREPARGADLPKA